MEATADRRKRACELRAPMVDATSATRPRLQIDTVLLAECVRERDEARSGVEPSRPATDHESRTRRTTDRAPSDPISGTKAFGRATSGSIVDSLPGQAFALGPTPTAYPKTHSLASRLP